MNLTPGFRTWLDSFAPSLLKDSYTFKRPLLRSMQTGFENRGPTGAVAASREWESVHRRLVERLADENPPPHAAPTADPYAAPVR